MMKFLRLNLLFMPMSPNKSTNNFILLIDKDGSLKHRRVRSQVVNFRLAVVAGWEQRLFSQSPREPFHQSIVEE